MDNYDPNLILDLAAGRLPEADARAAEAALSPEGRAELEAQRAVLAAIATEAPVAMTDIERARLHRAVTDGIAATTRELTPVAIAQPRPPVPHSRSVRWFRWASAATAAALFVGVVAVGSQLADLGGGSDASDTTGAVSAEQNQMASTVPAAGADRSTTSIADSPTAADGATGELFSLSAPPVRDDADTTDLDEVERFLLEARQTQRSQLDPTRLACYEEAAALNVVTLGFPAPFESADGEVIQAILFSFESEDETDAVYSYYRPETCELLLSNTEEPAG